MHSAKKYVPDTDDTELVANQSCILQRLLYMLAESEEVLITSGRWRFMGRSLVLNRNEDWYTHGLPSYL